MRHRERILAALRHGEPARIPMSIHFAARKYEEFVTRTEQTDTSAYFDLDYRHVPVKPPRALPDYSCVGVQTVMPLGTPAEVRAAVRKLIADAGWGGGFVATPAHLIERDIPWENILAFVEAVRECGRRDA